MNKYYITSDKIGEFVAKMYAAGIEVSVDPSARQVTIKKPEGGYEWVHIFNKTSFDELCSAFIPNEEK
jgi:hypothetical protein